MRCEVEETNDNFIYSLGRATLAEDLKLTLSKEELASEIAELKNFKAVSETVISTEKLHEVLVRKVHTPDSY